MATKAHFDHWRYERSGYEDRPVIAYAATDHPSLAHGLNWIAWERRLAALILLAGGAWAVRNVGHEEHNLAAIWETPGIVESCGISALLWLHAWWRSTVRLR